MPSALRNCGTCAHARRILQGGSKELQLVCAANTPTLYPMPIQQAGGVTLNLLSLFPPVNESMGCSRHEPEKPG